MLWGWGNGDEFALYKHDNVKCETIDLTHEEYYSQAQGAKVKERSISLVFEAMESRMFLTQMDTWLLRIVSVPTRVRTVVRAATIKANPLG